MDRYAGARTSYGTETFEKISNSKILVIGAGGIGCELLKNLVMFGFKSIDIVDLDTIDVSNLNRQFLFRPCNVGQSKALVAADIAKKFNSDVSIKPYHGNIKDSKFGVSFFKKFDLVLNALDNVDARRHVNRLCLAAERPLLDSGTTGYLGQVMPIIKHRTACYECQPKPTQKVYPICTIRSTPDKPVHCIVWAKELFKLLFNKPSESMLHEDDNKDGKESVDVSTYMHVVDLKNYGKNETCNDAGALSWFDVVLNHIEQMLIGVFTLDIEKRISMDIYKTAKKTPVPISQSIIKDAIKKCSLLINAVINFDAKCVIELLHATVMNFESLTGLLARKQLNIDPKCKCTIDAEWDSTVLPIDDVLVEVILLVFLVAAVNMPDTHQIAINQASLAQYKSFYQLGLMEFDKDDAYAMRFVSLCSNLRMNIFHISCINYHDCKGIAGNIIPAIPATNAIVAGIQVMQAINILKDGVDTAVCPLTYCIRNCTRKGVFIQPTVADFPSSSCYVCNSSQIKLEIDTAKATLQDFVTNVLKGKLSFNTPSINLNCNGIYEEGEGADETLESNLNLILAKCPGGGIIDGSIVEIEDFSQDMEVSILVSHKDISEFDEKENPLGFILSSGTTSIAATTKTASTVVDDDICEVMEVNPISSANVGKKRGIEEI